MQGQLQQKHDEVNDKSSQIAVLEERSRKAEEAQVALQRAAVTYQSRDGCLVIEERSRRAEEAQVALQRAAVTYHLHVVRRAQAAAKDQLISQLRRAEAERCGDDSSARRSDCAVTGP